MSNFKKFSNFSMSLAGVFGKRSKQKQLFRKRDRKPNEIKTLVRNLRNANSRMYPTIYVALCSAESCTITKTETSK
jgi:hypothetical protein